MNIFAFIGGWFKKEGASIEKLFKRIEPLVSQAEPIVKDIAVVAATVGAVEGGPTGALLTSLAGYLKEAVKADSVVDGFVAANANAPVNSILHNAAALALQYTHGTGSTAISDIDTAVQLAYSAVKEAAPPAAAAAVVVK